MSTEAKPKEYRGPLSPAAAAEGINAAVLNSRRLVDDAKILLEAKRYPTAASLAALAIEESGKVSILRGLSLAGPDDLRDEWRRYRDHRSKNAAWILPELFMKGARRLFDLYETVNKEGEHTVILNALKQCGLYSDCYVDVHWSEPHKVIDASLAQELVGIAELLSRKVQVTVREMELWVHFLRPVWRKEGMEHALLNWASAMHREGLTHNTPEDYARFIYGEINEPEMA